MVAVKQHLTYNRFGDHDPEGLVLVPEAELPAVRSGRRQPRPLVLYVHEGEWVELRLRNELPPLAPPEHPQVPVDARWVPSRRVGVFPQFLAFDPSLAGGGAVGFNPDATAGPGEEITYRWRAGAGSPTGLLCAGADPRTHRHRGLFGAVVVLPPGTVPTDPRTGLPTAFGEHVWLRHPLLPTVSSFTLLVHDGAHLRDARGQVVPDPGGGPGAERVDVEDRGQRGLGYRNEPFRHRLRRVPAMRYVFGSFVHGDTSTRLLQAKGGAPVTLHLLHAVDKPRTHSFLVHGHRGLSLGTLRGEHTIGAISVGFGRRLGLAGGAGGWLRRSGDYAYRSGVLRWHPEMGLWGIFRVTRQRRRARSARWQAVARVSQYQSQSQEGR